MEKLLRHSGFKPHRLKEDDPYYRYEIKALDIFNREHLEYINLIVFGQKEGKMFEANDELTKREENIVLSVIQWLGTPVGEGFVRQIFEKDGL